MRPYYIPPSAGLSSSPDSPPPPEIASASSAHVFGSSARDLLPDLDYSDYLDSSPSLSDWIRDALDRAIWRYTSTLTAQPFDVAKTILQAYAMPDAEEGQWALDGQRDPAPHTRDASYDDDVCVVFVCCLVSTPILTAPFYTCRTPNRPTMRAVTSRQPLLSTHYRPVHAREDLDIILLTAAVTSLRPVPPANMP